MYRRPRSLEVLLNIRTAMSEECGNDVRSFVEMIRSGLAPVNVAQTVTREEGTLFEERQNDPVPSTERVDVSDR